VDELDALRRRVLNVVGHALRTPVTTLCGLADELSRAEDPAQRALLADAVRRNSATVEGLLDDLLVASGVSTVLPVEPPAPVPVASAVREAWRAIGGDDALVVDGDVDATVDVPPACIHKPMLRLLENAACYGTGSVEVHVAADGEAVAIAVVSHGGRPNDDEIPHLLEPFYRGEHAVMAAPGLGVGLPVAQALARHAGGDVTIVVDGDEVVATLRLRAA
jgi:K+-sensing histidine kinase KdpD